MTAHSAVLQRPAIDNHLARLTRHTLHCSRKRHLITGPSVWYILDSKGDSDEDIWTLQSHSIDRIMHGVTEEVGLAGGMRRLSTPRRQCVWQCQRSAKSAAVTVTTSTGHLSTVVGQRFARRRGEEERADTLSVRERRRTRRLASAKRSERSEQLDTAALPTIEPAPGVPSGR